MKGRTNSFFQFCSNDLFGQMTIYTSTNFPLRFSSFREVNFYNHCQEGTKRIDGNTPGIHSNASLHDGTGGEGNELFVQRAFLRF